MNSGVETWLVARREITTQLRSRTFLVVNIITVVVVVGGIIAYSIFGGKSGPKTETIGLAPQTSRLAPLLTAAAATQGIGLHISAVSADAAASAVRDKSIDAAILADPLGIRVLTRDGLDQNLGAAVELAVTKDAAARALRSHGVTADELRSADEQVTVTALASTDPAKGQRITVAIFGIYLVFFAIFQFAAAVASGVVEEKSSRVVELLLSTLRPIQILVGKIAGLGVVGMGQTVVLGAAALIAGTATHSIRIGLTAGWVLAAVLCWFLLGYLFFATLFAATGSMVSRQEDARSATAPVTLLLTVSFYVAFGGAFGNDGTVLRVLSWIPPFSIFLMPTRVAQNTVQAPEFAAAAVIMLLAGVAVAVLASRIYHRSVLTMGAKVSWRHALSRG